MNTDRNMLSRGSEFSIYETYGVPPEVNHPKILTDIRPFK
jgi:hypothetical protein